MLQQSALSANDAWSARGKQAALLELVLALHDRALDLVERGVGADRVEALDLSDAIRARDRVGPDDAAGVQRIRDELLERLGALA